MRKPPPQWVQVQSMWSLVFAANMQARLQNRAVSEYVENDTSHCSQILSDLGTPRVCGERRIHRRRYGQTTFEGRQAMDIAAPIVSDPCGQLPRGMMPTGKLMYEVGRSLADYASA